MSESHRQRLPKERKSITVHARIDGTEGHDLDFFITAGLFEDGRLGEVFIKLGDSKSDLVQGLLDTWCMTLSIALQHGADFETLVRKVAGMKFQPSGATNDQSIPYASSVVDYVARWLAHQFGSVKLIASLAEA